MQPHCRGFLFFWRQKKKKKNNNNNNNNHRVFYLLPIWFRFLAEKTQLNFVNVHLVKNSQLQLIVLRYAYQCDFMCFTLHHSSYNYKIHLEKQVLKMPKTKKLNQTGSFWILCFQNWFSRCIVNLFSKTIFYVFSPKNSLCHLLLISFKKKKSFFHFSLKKKKPSQSTKLSYTLKSPTSQHN